MNEIVRRTVHVAAMFPAVLVTHGFGDWNQGVKKLWDRGMTVGAYIFFANLSGNA